MNAPIQIGKLVNKIVAAPLAKEGFNKLPTKGSGSWTFGRPEGDHHHIIQIQSEKIQFQSGPSYSLAITLGSTAYDGMFGISLSGILEDLPYIIRNYLRYYDTEQEIEEYLTIAVKVIVESAMPLFSCLDRPDVRSSDEIHKQISENTRQRAESFMKKHDLCFSEDVAEVKGLLLRTEEIIKTVQFEPFEEVTGMLVDATAYWGELIRTAHGGQWQWDPYRGVAYFLGDIGGLKSCQSGSINTTIDYWVRPEIYSFGIRFKYKGVLHKLSIEDFWQ